jgi:DNA-binding NarL/FixJ family response regulator
MDIESLKTKVLIADSQFLTAEACRRLLEEDERFVVLGVISTKYELEKMLLEMDKGILIADLAFADFGSITEFKNMLFPFPNVQVLILTNTMSKNYLVEFNNACFKNIIYKTSDRDELFSAIESTIKGKKNYSPELLDLMFDMNMDKQSPYESKVLTSSEKDIVNLISRGFTTKEIASRKNISYHTVNTHRKNIFRKMGVSNSSELIMNALKAGWIDSIEYYI